MIIFSTLFYVKQELTKEKFMEMVCDWINRSPHYGFGSLAWDGKDYFEQEAEKQKFSLILSENKKILAIRLENVDEDDVIWTNDFILEEIEEKNILVVRLAREAFNKESNVTRGYNRPRLMKKILEKGYGAMDGDLLISDKPQIINQNNIEIIEKVIKGESNYLLPVVFVTKRFMDNKTILGIEDFAKDLAGSAHVLVEENTDVTMELKKRTEAKNPFDGAVQVYFTNRMSSRIIPDEFCGKHEFRHKIVNTVCARMALLKMEEKHTWSTIKYQKLLDEHRKNKEESSELEKTCEEILRLKEKENQQLIDDMEMELNELRSKVQTYEYALQKKERKGGNINLFCGEEEFFEGEITDLILNVLNAEKKKMCGDPNQIGWRKYHLLSSLVEQNEIKGNGSKLALELKEILTRVDGVSGRDKRRLMELGFVVKHNGHNKLYFHNDDRYFITLANSPSDSHAAPNAAQIAINTIVCDK